MKGIASLLAFMVRPQLAAIQFELQPGWHIYWANPGESGIETQLTSTGTLMYPVPKKMVLPGDIINYGYEGDVTFFVQDPAPSTVQLRWLICKEDLCVPGRAAIPLQEPSPSFDWKEAYSWLPPRLPNDFITHKDGQTQLRVAEAVDFFPSAAISARTFVVSTSEGSLTISWRDGIPKDGRGLVVIGENRDRGYWVEF